MLLVTLKVLRVMMHLGTVKEARVDKMWGIEDKDGLSPLEGLWITMPRIGLPPFGIAGPHLNNAIETIIGAVEGSICQ